MHVYTYTYCTLLAARLLFSQSEHIRLAYHMGFDASYTLVFSTEESAQRMRCRVIPAICYAHATSRIGLICNFTAHPVDFATLKANGRSGSPDSLSWDDTGYTERETRTLATTN